MNTGTFTYGLLQYHHSQLLGEVLNIGLIVYFPQQHRLEFIYPEKLLRLRYAYPNIPEKTIKSYFKYFQKRIEDFNAQPSFFNKYDLEKSLQSFLENEFLPSDSSALQFGNYRTSVLYTDNLSHIRNQLYNLYFSVFKIQDNTKNRVDESVLLKQYKKLLKKFGKVDFPSTNIPNFQLDYAIEQKDSAPIKFDVAWKESQNLHLVKAVSFDLLRADSIQRKAYQYVGQFYDLKEYAATNDLLFDLILAKPKNHTLFKAYDQALSALEKTGNINLIDQAGLASYSEKTVQNVL
jgi:hypothetical protein